MTYGDYPDLSDVKKILVIKMRHHGDVLLTSPLFTQLKKTLPEAKIDAFIYQDTLPMLEGHPAITDFLLYDRKWKELGLLKKLAKELHLLRLIRKQKYDLILNLTEGDRGALAAWVGRSRYRVGFDPENKGFKGKKNIYTHLIKNCKTPRHTVERQLDALRRLGIFPSLAERDLLFTLPKQAVLHMQKTLQEAHILENDYIVIHPVSRWRFKCPPVSLVAELIDELAKQGKQVILTAGPDQQEKAMIESILKLVQSEKTLNLAGKTSLKELGALLKMATALICVDSVPLHMASALKVPVVALFGPSSEINWGPWMHPKSRVIAQKWACRPCHADGCGGSKRSDCLYNFSVKEIIEALQQVV